MPELSFLENHNQPTQIEELKGEQNYYNEIRRMESLGKIVKLGKTFESKEKALEYICETPSRRASGLSRFIPETDWVIGGGNGEVKAVAFSSEIRGDRLDKLIEGNGLNNEILKQVDEFVAESLLVYERDGVCPGVNLKNFVIDRDLKLFYVDSEPYPPYTIKPFEMAHARENRLKKLFGEKAEELFPKTWGWIKKHRVENFKAEKRKKVCERVYNLG